MILTKPIIIARGPRSLTLPYNANEAILQTTALCEGHIQC